MTKQKVLERALDQVGTLIAAITPEQASLPTPCRSWDVYALVNHVVDEVHQFAVTTGGGERNHLGVDVLGDDWAAAYRTEAELLVEQWEQPGVTVTADWTLGQQIAELAVHAWDIARATGQLTDLDPEVGQAALDWSTAVMRPEFRGAEKDGYHLGAEVPVAEDAPLYDRIAAFGGRDPYA